MRPIVAHALLAAALLAALAAAAVTRDPPHHEHRACIAELRSWIVAGWARHLYLDFPCPPTHNHPAHRVEFTTARLRPDYDHAANTRLDAPPLARFTPGRRLAPPPLTTTPDDRLEHTYAITTAQLQQLQQDRLFPTPYALTTTNSNAALRMTLNEVGLRLPEHLRPKYLTLPLGAFPGIHQTLPNPAAIAEWPALGFPEGPAAPPSPRAHRTPEASKQPEPSTTQLHTTPR